jgi:hypothetical protein
MIIARVAIYCVAAQAPVPDSTILFSFDKHVGNSFWKRVGTYKERIE